MHASQKYRYYLSEHNKMHITMISIYAPNGIIMIPLKGDNKSTLSQ